MNSTQLWGTYGIIATVVVAVFIYLLQKKTKYPGELRFSILELTKVMGTSNTNYLDLSLNYHGYEIKEDLSFVKLVLYNDKSFDYSNNDKDNPVKIILPKKCKWIDAKIVNSSEQIQADAFINKDNIQELDLLFKLLKEDEFIEIDGLIESKTDVWSNDLQDVLEITHRIYNVGKVKKTNILNKSEINKSKGYMRFSGIMFLAIILILCYAIWINPASPLKFVEIDSGKIVTLYVNKDGMIVYHKGNFIWDGYSTPMTPSAAFKQYKPSLTPSKLGFTDYFYFVFFAIIIVFLGYVFFYGTLSTIKTKRFYKIFNKKKEKTRKNV